MTRGRDERRALGSSADQLVHRLLELADVAAPLARSEGGDRLGAEADVPMVLTAEPRGEERREVRNLGGPLP